MDLPMNEQEKYLKDVFDKSGLRDYHVFIDVLKCIAVKAGQIVTPSVITTAFNTVLNAHISHNTIKKYFQQLIDNRIISKVERRYIKGSGKKIKNADHYYIADMKLFDYINQNNPFGVALGAMGEETYKLSVGRTQFYNKLLKLGYDTEGGRVEYFIRSKKVGSKRVGQNIDFMTAKNKTHQHFVFINKFAC